PQGEDGGRERELIGDADEAVDGEPAGEAEGLARGAEEEGGGAAGEAHEGEHQGEVGGERRHVPAPGRVEARLGPERAAREQYGRDDRAARLPTAHRVCSLGGA